MLATVPKAQSAAVIWSATCCRPPSTESISLSGQWGRRIEPLQITISDHRGKRHLVLEGVSNRLRKSKLGSVDGDTGAIRTSRMRPSAPRTNDTRASAFR